MNLYFGEIIYTVIKVFSLISRLESFKDAKFKEIKS